MNDEREALIRRAFRLEYLTLAWMIVEAAVAIGSGVRSGSVSVLAFGIDSLVELASAAVLIWRLTVELRHGQRFAEPAERMASRIAGTLLLGLAAYVVVSAGWKLWTRSNESFAWSGLAVTALAIPLMYMLARRKIVVAEALGSRAMRADAMEAVTCGWLSVVVLCGLLLKLVTGVWWADAAASLGVVWFLVKEGREAWSDEACACH
ncbi:cation diffusion facilitator family transporter [Lichenicoccus sp.]|uniref:cation diffusion facilitator family transporter n=1 Tax=Lichenicoccus sp. TaxID=2781899 RepID=UPI003D0D34E2